MKQSYLMKTDSDIPYKILNGNLGYINIPDIKFYKNSFRNIKILNDVLVLNISYMSIY